LIYLYLSDTDSLTMKYPDDLQKKYDRLTEKQKRFVDLWDGNGTNTAALVPYNTPKVAGCRCLKNVSICELINYKKDLELKPDVLSRDQRQKFWSDVVTGEIKEKKLNKDGVLVEVACKMQDRIKASELLGKSEGDFLLKLDVGIDQEMLDKILAALPEEYARAVKLKLLEKRAPVIDINPLKNGTEG